MSIWVRPVNGPITQYWGNGATGPNGYGGHPGTDYACANGTTIVAASDGVVIYAGPAEGFGDHAVSIYHPADNVTTTYGHMESHIVSVGQQVYHGQPIGLADTEGWATGPHLHFEVRPGNQDFGGNPPNIDSDLWLHNHGAYGVTPWQPAGQITQAQRGQIVAMQRILRVYPDGAWGPVTDRAIQIIRWFCLTPPNPIRKNTQVAQLQQLWGVTADGIWGKNTDQAFQWWRWCFLNK